MSNVVDSKVVEMKFDNRQFESNVRISMTTIDKLKKSLNFSETAKSLDGLTTAAKSVDMSALTGAAETVRLKFSALEVMAATALANITTAAINTGTQLVKSLSIDQVTAGWSKYEEKVSAVQTIMAATGLAIDDVDEQLAKLNWFSDETSYSFTDMTSNVGKFTSAGVELDTAVTAMQGIATWAALSGANSTTASRAMYNLSQAMGTGVVKLQDWMTIENCNMATEEFKTLAIETAKSLGTLSDSTEVTSETFRNTLAEGWFTSDVLLATLNNYGGYAQDVYAMCEEMGMTASEAMRYMDELGLNTSDLGKKAFRAAQEAKTFTDVLEATKDAVSTGWMNSFELVFGNYEEAKVLWTDLAEAMYDVFASGAEARNEILSEWKSLGGRDALIESFWNAWDGVKSIITPIKDAFQDIFPEVTAKQLYSITENLQHLTEKFKIGNKTAEKLKSTFKGVFAVLDITKEALSAVWHTISPMFDGLGTLGGNLLDITASWGEWLSNLDESIKKNDTFVKAIQKVIIFVKSFVDRIKAAKVAVTEFSQEIAEKLHLPDFETVQQSLLNFLHTVKEKFAVPGFDILLSVFKNLHERLLQIGTVAGSMKIDVMGAFESIGNALTSSKFLDFLQALWNIGKKLGSGLFNALGTLVGDAAKALGNADFSSAADMLNGISLAGLVVVLKNFRKDISEPLKGFQGILDGETNVLDSVRGCFEAYQEKLKADVLMTIASAIGVLTISIIALSLIDSEKLNLAIGAITMLFADLVTSMMVIGKIDGTGKELAKIGSVMLAMSTAIAILSVSLTAIAKLDATSLTKGIVGITIISAVLVASAKVLSSSDKKIMQGASSMILLAAAIKILASACKDLSILSWEELSKGLTGVGVLLTEIDIFLNTAKFSSKAISNATGMVILAAAIKILASACKDFGDLSDDSLLKGMSCIAILLSGLALFTKYTSGSEKLLSVGTTLILIAASMKIFASAATDLGELSWEEVARGLTAMGAALAEIIIVAKLMPNNALGMGMSLMVISASLLVLTSALSRMSSMSWEEVGKTLVVMGGALAELATALNLMNGTLSGSAALLVAAAALTVIAPVLGFLGSMSWEGIARGLISLAGAFVIIGVAVLTPLVGTILSLGGAFALIGVGVLGVGVGLLAIGAGLSAIAVGLTALVASVAGGATALLAALGVICIGLVEIVGDMLLALCDVVILTAQPLADAINALIIAIVDVFVISAPVIVEGLLVLIDEILKSFADHTKPITDSLLRILVGFLEALADQTAPLIEAAVKVIMALFEGVANALMSMNMDALLKGIVGIGLLAAIIYALSGVGPMIPGAMLGILGIAAVIAEMALLLAAIGALEQIPGLNWLIHEGGHLLEAVGEAIGLFFGGIAGGFMEGATRQLPQIGKDLSGFMENAQPFIDGARSIDDNVTDGVMALADVILQLTATNILQGLTSWFTGSSSLSKFGRDLAAFGPYFNDFYSSVKDVDGNAVNASANAALALAEMADKLPNSGGMASWFSGENRLSDFAEELCIFGPKLKQYADSVKGMDSELVTNSANAALALAEMAEKLPNQGGVAGWFAGENNLSAFAEELASFGPVLKTYANSVRGLDPDIVINSANAALALSELANNLPNSGGMASWFSGENRLSDFAMELATFGPSLKAYADSVQGLDTAVVINSANAASALSALADNLPNSGGVVGWFTGNNDIDIFGENMMEFGEYFCYYFDMVKTIDTNRLSDVINETSHLVDLANSMCDVKVSGMSNFSAGLTALGEAGVEDFMAAFQNSYGDVTQAAVGMMTSFINGANSKKSDLCSSFTSLMELILSTIDKQKSAFKVAGSALVMMIMDGISAKTCDVRNVTFGIVNHCLSALNSQYQMFHSAGSYLLDGFVNGINENMYKAEATARAMARAAANAAEQELDIHSPSRVGYRIGNYFGVGFVNALSDNVQNSYEAGSNIAVSAKTGLSNALSKIRDVIDSDIDTQPTIRPVLDLSDVTNGVSTLNTMFSRSQALEISAAMTRDRKSEVQNGSNTPSGNVYQFTQNNYSPKSLSRLEIYRQTRNQLAAMKGAIGT